MDFSSQCKTPMMLQWLCLKKEAGSALLFFRLGDFYEAFFDDAATVSTLLDVVLTQRQNIPMSGIPVQSLDNALAKIVGKGYLVAVAEQVSVGAEIAERKIVAVYSPSTLNPTENASYHFCASISQLGERIGLALTDYSTGEIFILEFSEARWADELALFHPKEIIISKKLASKQGALLEELKNLFPFKLHIKEEWEFEPHNAYDFLKGHFGVHSLDSLGLHGMSAAINSASVLLSFLKNELHRQIGHIRTIKTEATQSCLLIDRLTQRHLELLEPQHRYSTTLFEYLDATLTPMGKRGLEQALLHPLLDPDKISERHDAIEELLAHPDKLHLLQKTLTPMKDLCRLATRAKLGIATPRDLQMIGRTLFFFPDIATILSSLSSKLFKQETLCTHQELSTKILSTLSETLTGKKEEGFLIRQGVDPKLDELREFKEKGHLWLAEYQLKLRTTLGIKTLKVEYSRSFGYFIEVSRGLADKMPEGFVRRQTLVNAERFLSVELKEFETKITECDNSIAALEQTLFLDLRQKTALEADSLLQSASVIANIDFLQSLAELARKETLSRPIVDLSDSIYIEEGKHPILSSGKNIDFVANDTLLNEQDKRLMLITGPNMGGKSTYLRQVALIVILAQLGSFVPAKKAKIGIVDRIFSRIGASDDLNRGSSTFMVEMTETAAILNTMSARSLIILDEIGRGTGTFDGIAIAWAVAEFLLNHPLGYKAKVLFATHYSELAELEKQLPGAFNAKVAIHEEKGKIFFTHKIISGAADRSYGLHVAALAGLPHSVLTKAQKIMERLEKKESKTKIDMQLPLPFELPKKQTPLDKVSTSLSSIDPAHITPFEALEKIMQWKSWLGN